MSVTDKQGYVGDIRTKPLPELKELLERQEKLLKKQKFLESLPDKGIKVKKYAETLKMLIAEKESQPQKDSRFVIKTSAEHWNPTARTRTGEGCGVNNKGDNSVLSEKTENVSGDILVEGLKQVTISGDEETGLLGQSDNVYVNSYERVVKHAEENSLGKKHFKPNSTLKISKVEELPEVYKHRSKIGQSQNPESGMDTDAERISEQSAKSTIMEESAVCIPQYKHDKSVLISIEESVQLVEEQRKKYEELQTRQAAQRLADRLHIRLDDYNPEGRDLQYRVATPDTDSDDEPEVDGYEDD